MRINFDFGDLEAFLAVAELGSFLQAAEQLSLSQPALTRRIQKLEQAVGAVLLERTTRSVLLTLAGKNFRVRAETMFAEAQEALLVLRDDAQQFEYQRNTIITLAIIPTVTRNMLAAALNAFRADRQLARLRFIEGSANQVVEAVLQGQADFGLSFVPADEPDLQFTPLQQDHFVLAMLEHDPLFAAAPLGWAEIDTNRLIVPWKGTGNRMLIDDALAHSGQQLGWAYEVQRTATVLDMVAAGIGIAPVPQSALLPDTKVVARQLVKPEVTRTLGVIQRAGYRMPRAAESLLQHIRESCRLTLFPHPLGNHHFSAHQ